MIPLCLYDSVDPVIVNVFPAPVCPKHITVPDTQQKAVNKAIQLLTESQIRTINLDFIICIKYVTTQLGLFR